MLICPSIDELRKARALRGRAAFVPTMGNLHEGHLALMRAARAQADCVIASIFVNRLQFGAGEDFDRYPRTFEADCAALREAGVDVLFAPTENALYPAPQTLTIDPGPLAAVLEGEYRPGHFAGVATVVAKLFNIVSPQVALFGKKDYQQLQVIRQLTNQLAMPIEIIGLDTVRAEDGLALSSRNGYLSSAERTEAPRLSRLLRGIADDIRAGSRDYTALAAAARTELNTNGWQTDYVAVRKQADLQCPTEFDLDLVILAASRLGSTRLIDNLEVRAANRGG